jgi:hypothetical protein
MSTKTAVPTLDMARTRVAEAQERETKANHEYEAATTIATSLRTTIDNPTADIVSRLEAQRDLPRAEAVEIRTKAEKLKAQAARIEARELECKLIHASFLQQYATLTPKIQRAFVALVEECKPIADAYAQEREATGQPGDFYGPVNIEALYTQWLAFVVAAGMLTDSQQKAA